MNFIQINGHTIHYRYQQNATSQYFVFINSLGTDYRIWDDVANELSVHGSVLRFDKPGHGLSSFSGVKLSIDEYGAIVIGLLDALQIKNCTLIGLSIGGMIALKLAARFPDRISALILSNTAQQIGNAELWNNRISAVREKGMASVAGTILDRWLSSSFIKNRKETTTGLFCMLANTSVEGYVAACEAIRDEPFIDSVNEIKCPVLCIAGSEDVATTTETVKQLCTNIPSAKLSIVDGAGHLPCIEYPSIVAQLIVAHIENTASDNNLYATGMQTRRSVLGNVHVDKAEANKTTLDADFQQYITEQAWGAVWSRPYLTKRERSMLTIALLTALGHEEELAMHIKATINTGATEVDIREVLLHTAVYAGVPPVNGAFKIAKEIFADTKK